MSAQPRTTTNGAAHAPNKAAEIEVRNPVTGEVIGSVPICSEEDVRAAVERARAAQPAWEARGAKERAYIMRAFGDLLWTHRPEAMRLIRQETGKNDTGAFLECYGITTEAYWLYHHTASILRPQRRPALLPLIQYAK